MHFGSEKELEDFLFDNWWELRSSRLQHVLPGRHLDRECAELHRQVRIPGSGANGGNGAADLVEVFFHSQEELSLYQAVVSVVELKNRSLVTADISQLSRYMQCLSESLTMAHYMRNIMSKDCGSITVRGLLLGPSADSSVVNAATAMGKNEHDMGVHIGTFSIAALSGFAVSILSGYQDHGDHDDDPRPLFDKLIAKNPAFGRWHSHYSQPDEMDAST